MLFRDRRDAGRKLARMLGAYRGADAVVLALPRGGVPVACEVAHVLDLPLDVLLVRKLGVPRQPELAMGAIGENGVRVVNARVVGPLGVSDNELERVETRERAELDRRATVYRGKNDRVALRGRTTIIVDDGLATGASARAAAHVVRELGATRIVLAVPVAPRDTVKELEDANDIDDVVVVAQPDHFHAIGEWYDDFRQLTDDEVVRLLSEA